jgi:predicted nucleotidyltransferase
MVEELPVKALEQKLKAQWKHLSEAREQSQRTRDKLRTELERCDSADTSIIIFGSLARGEFTEGSDIDWTLLIDGATDPNHLNVAHEIEAKINTITAKKPGREGVFGSMTFSHELVHLIGGQDDTNRNTTRRILLLLESEVIGRREAYDRVIRNVLNRYLLEDTSFVNRMARHHVPRFLLNDFARYWRTMAVDFAYKRRTRYGKGIAIRNLKLRISRKLIYVGGLLTCFACESGLCRTNCQKQVAIAECIEHLQQLLQKSPLDLIASIALHDIRLEETARKVLGAYDKFIGILASQNDRNHLENLTEENFESDKIYQGAREVSHQFRDAVLELFFEKHDRLTELSKIYGVF